jgi:hypothetical protein
MFLLISYFMRGQPSGSDSFVFVKLYHLLHIRKALNYQGFHHLLCMALGRVELPTHGFEKGNPCSVLYIFASYNPFQIGILPHFFAFLNYFCV